MVDVAHPGAASERVLNWAGLRLRTIFAVLAIAVALVSLGLYRVWSEYQVFTMGARLQAASVQHRALIDEQRRLELERSALEYSMDIAAEAKAKLGMRVPDDRDYVVVPQ